MRGLALQEVGDIVGSKVMQGLIQYVNSRILNWTLWVTGDRCSCNSTGAIWLVDFFPVTILAAEF